MTLIDKAEALAALETVWRTVIGGAEVQRKVNAAIAAIPARGVGVPTEAQFMDAVWAALKADATDLGKQQRILAAFRAALAPTDAAQAREAALREAAARLIAKAMAVEADEADWRTWGGPDPRGQNAEMEALARARLLRSEAADILTLIGGRT